MRILISVKPEGPATPKNPVQIRGAVSEGPDPSDTGLGYRIWLKIRGAVSGFYCADHFCIMVLNLLSVTFLHQSDIFLIFALFYIAAMWQCRLWHCFSESS